MAKRIPTFERQMAMYATYHRDPLNRLTPYVGIPAIVLAILIGLAAVPLPLGVPEGPSLAVPVAAAVFALWVVLCPIIGLSMGLFLLPGLLFAEWLGRYAEPWVIWTSFGVLFAGGWALQFWGHWFEGRRPALVSNLFQALIGPMFIMAELQHALGIRRGLKRRVEEIVAERYPDYAAPPSKQAAE